MPADFLLQQMQWREALDDAHTESELDALNDGLQAARREALADIAQALDADANPARAAQQVRALMFIERFAHDVEARFEQLGQ
jgi:molecular chaperone HscB